VSPPAGLPIVMYVVSRFPAVTETFVINEWTELSGRFRMELSALRHSGEAPMHPESRRAMPAVRFLDPRARSTLAAHAAWFARRPATYAGALLTVLRAGLRSSPARAAKDLVAFVEAVALARAAAQEGVAHVHAHFANHPATAAWVVHRLTGIPFSFTAHANDVFVNPTMLGRKVTDARFAVAISEYNRRVLLDHDGGTGHVEVVHCGVDLERFPWRDLPGRDRDSIVCVASLSPKKGHAHLIDALALLAERHPSVVLALVGDGPERDAIVARARDRGVAERVQLLGSRPWPEVRAALGRARVVVLPSVATPEGRMEGIPVALMEAMASGAPVVATRLSGIPELVQDGVTGLLAAPGDAGGLASAIGRLLDDDSLATELVANARALVERSFSLEREARRLGDLFDESIAEGATVRAPRPRRRAWARPSATHR
jgi:colanic acid/amylovoran biosynthesis glycosyltransferase